MLRCYTLGILRMLQVSAKELTNRKAALWSLSFIILLICFPLFSLQEMLSPPQNVTLTSENFHVLLAWEPGSGSGSDTQYEVESCQRYVTAVSRLTLLQPVLCIPVPVSNLSTF